MIDIIDGFFRLRDKVFAKHRFFHGDKIEEASPRENSPLDGQRLIDRTKCEEIFFARSNFTHLHFLDFCKRRSLTKDPFAPKNDGTSGLLHIAFVESCYCSVRNRTVVQGARA